MPEIETPPAPPPEQPPAAPETKTVTNTDGTFAENWPTMLSDESLHGSETLLRFKNVESLAKSYEHVRKQVPLDKTPIPNDTWGEGEWNEWYKAGGRPDTKEDYNIARHEEIPEEMFPKEIIEGYQELFHKIGLSKKQVDAIVAHNDSLTLAQITKNAEDSEAENDAIVSGLRTLWGLAYDQNVHRGNVAIEKDKDVAKDPAYKARLMEKINKDPDLIRFASNMGYKFVEHHIVEDPGIPSPSDIQQQITDIMADPKYTHKDPAVRQPLIDKVLMLRKKLNER